MSPFKSIDNAINKASHEASKYLTADLRREAELNGWKPEVVKTLGAHYDGSKFNVHVADKYKHAAHVHEYGDEELQPAPAIRKVNNRTHQAQEFFGNRLEKHLGDLL